MQKIVTMAEEAETVVIPEFPQVPSLQIPSEISTSEYDDLLHEIRSDFSVAECSAELCTASRYNDVDVVRGILHVHGRAVLLVNSDSTPLHMAAANGNTEVVHLLCRALTQVDGTDSTKNKQNKQQEELLPPNKSGNTALHWGAMNGHAEAVRLMLHYFTGADVLLKNTLTGRSALTEGFTSSDTLTIKYLLEHDSATEEKLLSTTSANNDTEDHSLTHSFVFHGGSGIQNITPAMEEEDTAIRIQIRELPMARHTDDRILGQTDPSHDTTGYGIWKSSLVTAFWMCDLLRDNGPYGMDVTKELNVLELGAGCGVPGLVVAKASVHANVYVTDFNPTTVENLQHNIDINNNANNAHACVMNWSDTTTFPKGNWDVVIGSDLVYQIDMVPLLLSALRTLRPRYFYYVGPNLETSTRQGNAEFLTELQESSFALVFQQPAPLRYANTNPLKSQSDDEFYLHFHDDHDAAANIASSSSHYALYIFEWKE